MYDVNGGWYMRLEVHNKRVFGVNVPVGLTVHIYDFTASDIGWIVAVVAAAIAGVPIVGKPSAVVWAASAVAVLGTLFATNNDMEALTVIDPFAWRLV